MINPCLQCGARPHTRCRSPKGVPRKPHLVRLPHPTRWLWKRVKAIRKRKRSFVLTLDCGHERVTRTRQRRRILQGYYCGECAAE